MKLLKFIKEVVIQGRHKGKWIEGSGVMCTDPEYLIKKHLNN